jgi:hypothetical protein
MVRSRLCFAVLGALLAAVADPSAVAFADPVPPGPAVEIARSGPHTSGPDNKTEAWSNNSLTGYCGQTDGGYVIAAQEFLYAWGKYAGPIDDYWGTNSKNALVSYQSERPRLDPDGCAGPKTWADMQVNTPFIGTTDNCGGAVGELRVYGFQRAGRVAYFDRSTGTQYWYTDPGLVPRGGPVGEHLYPVQRQPGRAVLRRRLVTKNVRRGLVAGVLVAGVVAMIAAAQQPADRTLPHAKPAADAGPLSTTSVSPAYLPPGARLADDTLALARFPDVRQHEYVLGGPADANTIPSTGLTDDNARTVHGETRLTVMFNPNVTEVPDFIGDPAFFDTTPVLVGGLPAVLTTPKDGYGAQRVDWVDAQGYHIVLCERLLHVEGEAGVRPDELVRVASSLY